MIADRQASLAHDELKALQLKYCNPHMLTREQSAHTYTRLVQTASA